MYAGDEEDFVGPEEDTRHGGGDGVINHWIRQGFSDEISPIVKMYIDINCLFTVCGGQQ